MTQPLFRLLAKRRGRNYWAAVRFYTLVVGRSGWLSLRENLQTIRRFFSTAWFAEVAWPIRIVRRVLVLYLVFGLTAVVAWPGFGRNAEKGR